MTEKRQWLVGSGCNRHMTPFKEDLKDLIYDDTVCKFGSSNKTEARGKGNVMLNCRDD